MSGVALARAKCFALAMRNTPDLIGTTEACRILRVNASTLTRWVALGEIQEAHKLPGKNGARLFDRRDVERIARDRGLTEAGSAA